MKKVPASVSTLNKIFPKQWMRESARRFRVVKRETKVDMVVLFWTLVMAPLTVTSLKIANLQRAFEGMVGITLASSAFQGRLSKELAAFLLASVRHAIEHMSVQLAALPLFSRFKDVLAQDSTLIKLPDVLATLLPGSLTNSSPAALKLNMVYSVVRATPHQIAVAKDREAEVTFLSLRRASKAVLAYGPRLLQELIAFLGLEPIYDLDLLILAASLDTNRQRDKLRKRLRNANPQTPQTLPIYLYIGCLTDHGCPRACRCPQ